jgi:hypothetical protein
VKFWHHALRRKNYVEIVQSAPGVEPVVKYDIAKVKPWDLPALGRLFDEAAAAGRAPPAVTPEVRAALDARLKADALARPSGGRGPNSFVAKAAAKAGSATASA